MLSLLLFPLLACALPQQPFHAPLPALNRSAFAHHDLLPLSDGSFFPSPAFGVGSIWKHTNVTDLVIAALRDGYRHIGQRRRGTSYGARRRDADV